MSSADEESRRARAARLRKLADQAAAGQPPPPSDNPREQIERRMAEELERQKRANESKPT